MAHGIHDGLSNGEFRQFVTAWRDAAAAPAGASSDLRSSFPADAEIRVSFDLAGGGTFAGTILREALTRGADEIIVACNHPSGDPRPSKADMAAVETLRAAAKLLGVTFVDHIILGAADSAGGQGFTSLAELAAEEAEG